MGPAAGLGEPSGAVRPLATGKQSYMATSHDNSNNNNNNSGGGGSGSKIISFISSLQLEKRQRRRMQSKRFARAPTRAAAAATFRLANQQNTKRLCRYHCEWRRFKWRRQQQQQHQLCFQPVRQQREQKGALFGAAAGLSHQSMSGTERKKERTKASERVS